MGAIAVSNMENMDLFICQSFLESLLIKLKLDFQILFPLFPHEVSFKPCTNVPGVQRREEVS